MNDIQTPLFEGQLICLAPIDHEKDPEIEAGWTNNAHYLQMLKTEPARPMSPEQVKKMYEKKEKDAEEGKNSFHFAVRTRPTESEPEGRLVGFAEIFWVEWSQGTGEIRLGIGDPQDWRKGYGRDVLRLLLRYVFGELNLRRIGAIVQEYNLAALGLFQDAGFVEEVRRREALNRDGRRWDILHLGLLRDEWFAQKAG